MKVEFVPVEMNVDISLPKEISQLPKKVALFVTSQLHSKYAEIKEQLEESGREVTTIQTRHTPQEGQILGCNIEDYEIRGEFDAFFYVGDGEFHPKALLYNNEKPVFVYNILDKHFYEMNRKEAERLIRKRKVALSTFYMGNNMGVLVTSKSGQNMLHKALKFQFQDKKFFILVDNTFNFQALNDFNFIDCWINTACPRIAYDDMEKLDKPVINFEEIPELGFQVNAELTPKVPKF